jgi:hypothetical protein
MKKALLRLFLIIWVLAGTVGLARFLTIHHALFPPFPEAWAIRLIELYGSTNGEELADLEILVALGLALTVILTITMLGWLIWRYVHHSLPAR